MAVLCCSFFSLMAIKCIICPQRSEHIRKHDVMGIWVVGGQTSDSNHFSVHSNLAVRSSWQFGLEQYVSGGIGKCSLQKTLRECLGVGWCVCICICVCGIRLHSLSLTRELQLWDQDRLLQVWARVWGSLLFHVGGSQVREEREGGSEEKRKEGG